MKTETETRPQTETEALFSLDKPSLHALSYILRHPDTWPKGFVWDYDNCDKCAMGVAYKLWSIQKPANHGDVHVGTSAMAQLFGIGYTPANSIFFGACVPRKYGVEEIVRTGLFGWGKPLVRKIYKYPSRREITPEMVADDIDKYLASAE